jgi:hypothetical protein
MASTEKVQGPASYFPSIEKMYGRPVEHWFRISCKAPASSNTWNW